MSHAYDRTPVRDCAFLAFETPNAHMHIGGALIFEAGPLATPGGVDVERIRARVASQLHRLPRYRQRLAWIPVQRRPVWVDDDGFDLEYHVRQVGLPPPGNEEQLKRLVACIISQPLDRSRPLWELWVINGVERGRFALAVKVHHCIANGAAVIDLISALLSPLPDETVESPESWLPRPVPRPLALLRDEVARGVRLSFDLVRRRRADHGGARGSLPNLAERCAAIREIAGAAIKRRARTPLNQPIGPERRFEWLTFDLDVVKRVKQRFGVTVNDALLAAVTGGVRRFLERRGVGVDALDYRALVPVSLRARGESDRASAWLISLPVDEPDPRRRLERVRQATAAARASRQEMGLDRLLEAIQLGGARLFTMAVRLTVRLSPYNLLVTNVAGPQTPLYMLGARLLAGYPYAPLFEDQAVAFAMLSYDRCVFIGINADRDLVPDLSDLAAAVADSLAELDDQHVGAARRADAR